MPDRVRREEEIASAQGALPVLVLGAGQQGTACAYDLLSHTDRKVLLADQRTDRLPSFLQPFLGERLQPLEIDARDQRDLTEVMQGCAVVCCALPYHFNLAALEAAVAAGAHYCDLGGNTEMVLDQKRRHAAAAERRLAMVVDCGVAPGMVNILAAEGIRGLDRVRSVRMMVGGLPQHPEPPLGYQVVYSLQGVLDYYTTRPWVLRGGVPIQVEALSEVEELDFEGVGRLESFHTAGGLSTMAQRYAGRIDSMEYRTLRFPGHAQIMRAIRDLGLLEEQPVRVDGALVVPRRLFLEVAGPRLRRDPRESPDQVVMRVEVRGEQGGREITRRWDLHDRYDRETGMTAMMRVTGFSLAVTATLLTDGIIPAGVWAPDEVVPAADYVALLRTRGVNIQHEENEGLPGGIQGRSARSSS